jgi:hypothetical protein
LDSIELSHAWLNIRQDCSVANASDPGTSLRFLNRFEPGKMCNCRATMLNQDRFESGLVTDVGLNDMQLSPAYIPDAVQRYRSAVSEIVDYNDVFARVQKFDANVGPDIASPSRDQDHYCCTPSPKVIQF